MLYGLYTSAAGVMTSTHRQDVIANNLANAETAGFKRDVSLFQQRLTEAQERRLPGSYTNPLWEKLGGGIFLSPTHTDLTQGSVEQTDNPLDIAIEGPGFFTVKDGSETRLTRDGRFMVDRAGRLMTATGKAVLNRDGVAIGLDPNLPVTIGRDGAIAQGGEIVGRLNVVDVADKSQLTKQGAGLFAYHGDSKQLRTIEPTLRAGSIEGSNVDPTTELVQLMETQRQLEANANMIRYQDQTLGKLVNEVGKIA